MRKTYQTPQLKEWGTVAQLTATGQTRPGTDVYEGSVNPAGHE